MLRLINLSALLCFVFAYCLIACTSAPPLSVVNSPNLNEGRKDIETDIDEPLVLSPPVTVDEVLASKLTDAEKYQLLNVRCRLVPADKAACYHQANLLINAGEPPTAASIEQLLQIACENRVTTPEACNLRERINLETENRRQGELAKREHAKREAENQKRQEELQKQKDRTANNDRMFLAVPFTKKWFCRDIFLEGNGDSELANTPCYQTQQECEKDMKKMKSEESRNSNFKLVSGRCRSQETAACFAWATDSTTLIGINAYRHLRSAKSSAQLASVQLLT